MLTKTGYQGVLFAWQAPGFDPTGVRDSARPVSDALGYMSFLKALRRAVGPDTKLFVTLPCYPAHARRVTVVLDDLRSLVDGFAITGWNSGPLGYLARHVSPLHGGPGTIADTVEMYRALVRREKLLLGFPLGGTSYSECSAIGSPYRLHAEADPAVLRQLRGNPDRCVRDLTAGDVPTAVDEATNALYSFDDVQSIQAKRRFAMREQLLGTVALLHGPLAADPSTLACISSAAAAIPLSVTIPDAHSDIAKEPVHEIREAPDAIVLQAPTFPPFVNESAALLFAPQPLPSLPVLAAPSFLPAIPLQGSPPPRSASFSGDTPAAPAAGVPGPALFSLPPVEDALSLHSIQAELTVITDAGSESSTDTDFRRAKRRAPMVCEWSPASPFDRGDIVRIGRRLFVCDRSHAPVYPLANGKLWSELYGEGSDPRKRKPRPVGGQRANQQAERRK